MDFSGIENYEFYIQVGYLTVLASVLTLVITQLIKMILKKKKVIYEGMEVSKKDMILQAVGRVTALIIYSCLYLANEFILKHVIVFDGALLTGLLTGAALTLLVAKAIYTVLHQWSKKRNVFERLEYVKQVKNELENALNEELSKRDDSKKLESNKWTLTNMK